MAREYKDSGIEWIGQIPKEWKVCQIRRFLKNRSERNKPNAEVLSLYRDWGIVPKNSRDDNHNVTSEDTTNYKVVHKGDFVINKMKAWQGSMAVSNYDGIISPAYYVCVFVNSDVSKRYIHHLLRNESYKTEYMRLSSGLRVGQWDLNIDNFLRIPMILPALSEQQKIADYLDKVCGEVDEMIALQEKMIEELKAYKQSVITEAVTKGLNPNVPMKDSGIDWIGEIPEHWFISKAKFFVIISNGSDPKTEGNTPVYGSGSSSFKTCGEYKNGPTVLIGRKGATLHIPHYIEGRYWNVDTAFDVKCKNNMVLKYYFYLAVSFDYKYFISQTTLPGMAQSSYNNMKIPIPSLSEQQQISSLLDTKCSDIDFLISIKQQKIEELKEYKKSVIYEYVTGKKEVV